MSSAGEIRIRIREAGPDDLQSIEEIAVNAWKPIYEGYRKAMGDVLFAHFHTDWEERKAGTVREELSAVNKHVLVAETEDRIAGFLTYIIVGNTGEISTNAVSAEFRGNRLSQDLYEYALDKMREAGCTAVFVETGLDEAHTAARISYERAGFKVSIPSVKYYMDLSETNTQEGHES